MSDQIVTRSPLDRLRYTVLFELILIAILAPLISIVMEQELFDMGLLALVLSIKAMCLNFIYNYCYDRIDVSYGRVPTQRSLKGRIIHAVGLELVLTSTSLPIIIWWLKTGFIEALLMDLTLLTAVLFYTLIYTWIYDRIFPVQQPIMLSQAGAPR
ncbi:PACE efflux transporter [Amphritea sp. HPY]|uniref:PACE efflux transporter n=1 Tax=Amphritea sp. HPY TaxID=3421652 RepID=UPI003D7CAB98